MNIFVQRHARRILLTCLVLLVGLTAGAQALPPKTGILLVHYGTRNDAGRARTLDALNRRVAQAFPQCPVREAYVAPTVVRALAARGIAKLSVPQAVDSLKAAGCTRLVVQTTMLLDGVMTDAMQAGIDSTRRGLQQVVVGRPLLYSVADGRTLIDMIARHLAADASLPQKNVQVVLVGHGSDSPANAVYSQLDYLARDEGRTRWHVGTIEGYPTLGCIERRLAEGKARDVVLVPLLYIAGNHQAADISGAWRRRLSSLGYRVHVVEKGLGEMPEVQDAIVSAIRNNVENKNNK